MLKRRKALKRGGSIARKTPVKKRSAKYAQRRKITNARRRARQQKDSLRKYGSEAFREYLHRTPCLWCESPFVVQAHLQGNGGRGRKGDWTGTGPLCQHCHDNFDRRSSPAQWFTAHDRQIIASRLAQFHARWNRMAVARTPMEKNQ